MFCSHCGTRLVKNAKFCSKCGNAIAASTAPAEVEPAETPELETAEQKKLTGVAGWLAWFVFGTGLSVLLVSVTLTEIFGVYSKADGTDYTALLNFEVLGDLLLIALAVATIVLIVQRKKLAKKMALTYLSVAVIVMGIDLMWAKGLENQYGISSEATASATTQESRGVVTSLIWIPYFLISKRVKYTLTK